MKFITTLTIIFFILQLQAQDFYRNDFDRNKKYILLANPTAHNIETIHYLIEKNILKVDSRSIHFVGIYHNNQNYNFQEAINYIEAEGLTFFHLHEIRKPLNDNMLFAQNELTDELRFLFDNSIGIFFFGGPDIPPALYGEENTHSVVTDPNRHFFECTFLFHLLGGYRNEDFEPFLNENPRYLVTGFCLGLQTMNIATGGTLIQDIPSEVYDEITPEQIIADDKENMHRNYWQMISDDQLLAGINFHTIHFTENHFFGRDVKVRKKAAPLVYSSHHQAVEKIGKGLEATACSTDGKIVEGLVHTRYENVFSVQFHPEVPALYENRDQYKIKPADQPETYHGMLGPKSVKFHRKYWKHISKALRKASR